MTVICNPLKAKLWWRLLAPVTWALSTMIFTILLCFFTFLIGTNLWVAFIFAVTATFIVHFCVLDLLVIGIKCSNKKCRGKIVEADTPWLCGYGKGGHFCKNENTLSFPFIYRCEHCGISPKAYLCHHCDQPIFLSKDQQKEQCARRLVLSEIPLVKDEVAEKSAKQKQVLHDLEHKVNEARLKKQIEVEKNKPSHLPSVSMETQLMLERVRNCVERGEKLSDLQDQLLKSARDKHGENSAAFAQAERTIMQAMFNERERMPNG